MTPEQLETQLYLWHGLEQGKASLINLSENHTFRIDIMDNPKYIIRVHRPNYQTLEAIKSELLWLLALKRDTDLRLVTPIAGVDNQFVQQIKKRNGQKLLAVCFAFENGREADNEQDEELFSHLGRFAAICHKHVENWQLPKNFTRPIWDENNILDEDGLWGNWRIAPKVNGEIREILEILDKRLRRDLREYGKHKDRFGLIHADMRLANILIDEGEPRLIDFDDCGFGWFAYDFGAAISFFEDSDKIPQLKNKWLSAYRKIRPFSELDEKMLDTLIMLRRLALLAWIGSHNETDLAQSLSDNFAENSAKMAQKYLTGKLYE